MGTTRKLKRNELIEAVAFATGHTRVAVREVLDATSEATKEALRQGGEVFLFGLGKVGAVERSAKPARHMVTGERIVVPAHRAVHFRASDSLRAAANAFGN